jgi:hypothetical protein
MSKIDGKIATVLCELVELRVSLEKAITAGEDATRELRKQVACEHGNFKVVERSEKPVVYAYSCGTMIVPAHKECLDCGLKITYKSDKDFERDKKAALEKSIALKQDELKALNKK